MEILYRNGVPFDLSATPQELADWLEEKEMSCEGCSFSSDCDKGVHGGPRGPIYPPCCETDYVDIIDVDLAKAAILDYLVEEYDKPQL